MEQEYTYWKISYTSCEGDERWTIARTPFEWTSWDVMSRINLGGCGDDPAKIIDVTETNNQNYSWDFE